MKVLLSALVMLAGCSMPPYAQETVVVEEVPRTEPLPEITIEPKAAPKAKTEKKPLPKADVLCPPKEGEADQERIIRKLDCLLERN